MSARTLHLKRSEEPTQVRASSVNYFALMNNAWRLCWILIAINHYLFKCKESRCSYLMIKKKSSSRASQQLHVSIQWLTRTRNILLIYGWVRKEFDDNLSPLAFGVRFLARFWRQPYVGWPWRWKRPESAGIAVRSGRFSAVGVICAGVNRDRCFVPRRDGTSSRLSLRVCLYVRACEHLLPLAWWCFKINSAGCEECRCLFVLCYCFAFTRDLSRIFWYRLRFSSAA